MRRLSTSLVPALAVGALIGADALLAGCGSSTSRPSTSSPAEGASGTSGVGATGPGSGAGNSASGSHNTPASANTQTSATTTKGTAGNGQQPGAGTTSGHGPTGGVKFNGPGPSQIRELLRQSAANECKQLLLNRSLSAKTRAEAEKLCKKLPQR
jgi:hypothetical protein